MNKSSIGVLGLGVMGKSLSLNIAEKGHSISVFNRIAQGEEHYVQDFLKLVEEGMNIEGFTNLIFFINSLKRPRKVLLMINAGNAIDQVIELLIPLLSKGDIIIDGGNSHYLDTKRRVNYLENINLHFMGVGISGGEEGARNGPSIMPGGNKHCYEIIAPILESIAAKDEKGTKCCTYIGPDGAGHFVKMVHNGIEYVEMQLIAEIYHLLSLSKTKKEIRDIFIKWSAKNLSSYLLEITADILMKKEGSNYILDLILDKAGNKGTGSWSTKAAFDFGTVNTMMSSAVFARYVSSFKRQRVSLSKKNHPKNNKNCTISINDLRDAYISARIINHRQGFELIKQASISNNWNLSLSDLSRIWTNGCIIRSELMVKCISYFQVSDDLFENYEIIETLNKQEDAVKNTLIYGINNRVPLASFSAANVYWNSMTSENLPSNLIQAQRDYFGAHMYQRVDAPENQFFHTNW